MYVRKKIKFSYNNTKHLCNIICESLDINKNNDQQNISSILSENCTLITNDSPILQMIFMLILYQ